MANNGIYYSSGNTLNFTTDNTTWATLTSGGTFVINTVSGGTYLNLPASTGGTSTSGAYLPLSGGTVTGATNFTGGLTANTISATTISQPFTTGSVIFQGSGGTLSQSNSQLFWDNTNNRFGVGTNTFWGTTKALVVDSATEGRLGVANTGKQGVYLGRVSNFSQIFAYDYTAVAALPLSINSFGGNVLIGTTTDSGYLLDVNGTSRLNGLSSINGVGVANTALAIYANGTGGGNYIINAYDSGLVQRFYVAASGNFRIAGATDTGTSGSDEKMRLTLTFSPTSGNREHYGHYITQTINQTGGASGITRGIYITPTLTSAYDYRAIETTIGDVMLNTISGNTLIGTTADTGTYKLDVNGATRVSGVMRSTDVFVVGGTATSNTANARFWSSGGQAPTSGLYRGFYTDISFIPTNGSSEWYGLDLRPTINQTGGANGVTRGLYIAAALTSAADFRAIETTVGNVILNGTSGNTIIGKTTDSGQKLQVSGNTLIQGGLTATTISATTYQNLPFSGSVTGSGTTGYLPKWTGSTGLSNSLVYDATTGVTIGTGFTWNNTNSRLGIGTSSPSYSIHSTGTISTGTGNLLDGTLRIERSGGGIGLVIQGSNGNVIGGGGYPAYEPYNYGTADHNFNIGHASVGNYNWFVGTNSTLNLNTNLMRLTRGGNLLIGTTTDSGYKLDVNGTARFTNYVYAQSGVTVGGTGGVAGVFPAAGSVLNRETVVLRGGLIPSDAGDDIVLSNGQGDAANTSSTRTLVNISRGFNPISGTGVYNILRITSPINQTGGANGITRGLYVNPTLTSAADFRAIEVERGKVILNSISGNTLIGTTADTGTYKLDVLGNTRFSATTGTSLTVISSGNSTSSPVFSVQGSQGELFSVTDSLTGSLFSVSDISGLPIMEVFSDSTIILGDYQAPSLYTTKRVTSITASTGTTIYSFPTSAYTSSFVDYYVSGSTGLRAGNIMAIWSGTSVNFTETSTNDLGNTTPLTFGFVISGSNAVLQASASTSTWIVKTIVRGL
jgi:hypothetical protein